MTRTALPKFEGTLSEPIVKSNRLANLNEEEERSFVLSAKVEKLFYLAKHYGIDVRTAPPSWTSWALVALRLAEDAKLPGFQVVENMAKLPRKRGRPRNSGAIDRFALRRVIEKMRADSETLGEEFDVSAACRSLSKPMGRMTKAFKRSRPESLETAYYKAVKEIKEHEAECEAVLRIQAR